MGKTKIMCRMPAKTALDAALRMAKTTKAISIQRVWRGYLVRKKCKAALDLYKEMAAWQKEWGDKLYQDGKTAWSEMGPEKFPEEAALILALFER